MKQGAPSMPLLQPCTNFGQWAPLTAATRVKPAFAEVRRGRWNHQGGEDR